MRKVLSFVAAAAMLVLVNVSQASAVSINNGYGYEGENIAFVVVKGSTPEELETNLNAWKSKHLKNRIIGFEYSVNPNSSVSTYSAMITYWIW